MFITSVIGSILRKQRSSIRTVSELAFCCMDLDVEVEEEVEGKWAGAGVCEDLLLLYSFLGL